MEPAVRIENLGKRYLIGHQHEQSGTSFREMLTQYGGGLVKKFGDFLAGRPIIQGDELEEFWALREVGFEVAKGEVVGIVGHNGAGKSTMLKLLSRIAEPTEGRITIDGRVASLLEVGTGFHPELTGRENIYLNGTILGMSRREIRSKFDEIVAFAEVERFLDTPVKRYSSGMYVRLAFAVASHLDPEILIIDEVLAVGDTAFQAKCIGKMKDVADSQGRTVLFVSHSMPAVLSLCDRVVWLKGGRKVMEGATAPVVDAYTSSLADQCGETLALRSDAGDFLVEKIEIGNAAGERKTAFAPGERLAITVHYHAREPIVRPQLWFRIFSKEGPFWDMNSLADGHVPEKLEGRGTLQLVLDGLPLAPDQVFTLRMGARRANRDHFLLPTTDIGTIRTVASAADLGFAGEGDGHGLGGLAPLLHPYEWVLPDGERRRVDPLRACGGSVAGGNENLSG